MMLAAPPRANSGSLTSADAAVPSAIIKQILKRALIRATCFEARFARNWTLRTNGFKSTESIAMQRSHTIVSPRVHARAGPL